jgi:hypothetical protein
MKLIKQDLKQAWEPIWSSPIIKIRDEIRNQVKIQIWSQIRSQVRVQVWSQVWDRIAAYNAENNPFIRRKRIRK